MPEDIRIDTAIVFSQDGYNELVRTLTDGPVFVSSQHSDNGTPRSFPCMVKIIRTGVMNTKESDPSDAHLLMFFYVGDAHALLSNEKKSIPEGYDYAEARPERG